MAEPLLTFSAREFLKKVVILAGEEFSIVWGFKKELEKLRTTSDKLQGLLQAAENLTHNLDEGTVKPWVAEIERIAGAADDLLDDFRYEVLRRKVEEKKVLSLFDPLVFRHKMGRRIKKINESLEKLEKQAASFQLVIAGNARSDDYGVLDRQTVPSFDDDEKNMIGRDEFVSNIVSTLTSIKEDLSVSAIVGMAGLGKTTVAKAIYNDYGVGGHFQRKIWVCVSTPFDVEMILSEILGYLNGEKAAVRGKAAILNHLKEQLEGKRYLLILDDVWNEDVNKWSDLRNCLRSIGDTKGSSIIVTTRNRKVAEVMETLLRFDIGKLSDDECWHILKRNAVAVQNILPEDQERTGKEIAKKCGGVPLAAKVLGSLMRFKSHSEWLEIERSSIWDLEESHQIFAILKLSFSGLQSPSLKKCFACCSIFEKDANMGKNDLIQLWMALGLLEPSSPTESQEDMENKGSDYFNILLANSLFQDVRKNEYGIVTHCKMHDLFHDLAEHVSGSSSSTRYSNNCRALELTHHTSMLQSTKGGVRKLLSDDEAIGSKFSGFKTLRILNLDVKYIELPNSIGKLKHLRYLDVSHTYKEYLEDPHTYIAAFPKSIGKLYNLQTLRFPSNLCLEGLPKGMENLINLRHIYFSARMQFPDGIGKLTSLRSLTNYERGEGCGIEQLSGLNHLNGVLHIRKLEYVRDGEAAQKANLVEKKNIHKLRLEWSDFYNVQGSNEVQRGFRHIPLESLIKDLRFNGRSPPRSQVENQWLNDDDVLEGLQPPSSLKSLEIRRFNGDRFPLWMMSNLMEIELVDCNKCEGLPILGHLPKLNHIQIRSMNSLKCVGSEWYGYDHVHSRSEDRKVLFPALKTFYIERADNLTDWMEVAALPTERVRVFPCLEELTVKRCEQLTSAPTHFPSLQKLEIEGVNNARMVMKNILSRNLTSLTSLKLERVGGMTRLPVELFIGNMNLAHLDLYACYDLTHIGPLAIGPFASLKSLKIHGCSSLRHISHGLLTASLEKLHLSFCVQLVDFPDIRGHWLLSLQELSICDCHQLISLPRGLEYCPSLEKLKIRSCYEIKDIQIGNDFGSLGNVEIHKCGRLSTLPSGLETCTSVQTFAISECPEVMAFPVNNLTTSLQELKLSKVEILPTIPGGFTSLRVLTIEACYSTEIRLDFCASVQVLTIEGCPDLESAPNLDNLTSLRKLTICGCPRLTTLPMLNSHPCLKHLVVGPLSEELDSFPFSQGVISAISPQLEKLELFGWPKLGSIPDEIQEFTSLTDLEISMFDEMETIPEWLGNLASLRDLTITDCKSLKYLPSAVQCARTGRYNGDLDLDVNIYLCPLLDERCGEDQNSDE